MIKVPKLLKSAVSVEMSDKGKIAYKLTGADLLAAQGYNGKGIKVAVLDTGADYNHPLLAPRIKERNHKTVAYLTDCMDEEGHGTHVCGVYALLAPECEIIPWKVIAPYGGEFSWLAQALNEVADRDDIDIVNMSLSGQMVVGSAEYILVHEAVKRCVAKDIFVNVASGNTGTETELYPACFDEVTTWGAVDIYKASALFSTESNQIDVCQIGVDLMSCALGSGYVSLSGTSMATPMGGAITALLAGKYKEMFGKRIPGKVLYQMLKLSAVDLGIKGLDKKTGAGYVSLNASASIVTMTLDSNNYKVNNVPKTMDTAPFLKQSRTFVPVRYASEGGLVIWDPYTREVTIVK